MPSKDRLFTQVDISNKVSYTHKKATSTQYPSTKNNVESSFISTLFQELNDKQKMELLSLSQRWAISQLT